MLQKKYSANDLTLDIHNLYKKYNMVDYYSECCTLMRQYASEDAKEDIEKTFKQTNNIIVLQESIMDFVDKANVSDDMVEEFISKTLEIQEKYKFDVYSKKCFSLRKKFLNDRKSYLRNNIKFIALDKKSKKEMSGFNVYNFHDMILSKWIDDILEQTYPESIEVVYEDLNGKIETITVNHHPDHFSDTGEIETRPIDRFSGMGIFDSFLLHALYDTANGTWKYVPVTLICSVSGKYIDDIFNNRKAEYEDEDDGFDNIED